jgi:hypothetical protein
MKVIVGFGSRVLFRQDLPRQPRQGVGAAYLARRDGATYPAALRQGCTALASTLLVVTALVSAFVAVLPR